jgi:hypothetical protein
MIISANWALDVGVRPSAQGHSVPQHEFLLPVRRGELFVRDTAGFLSNVVGGSEIPAKETHLPGYILFKQRSSFRELPMDADRGCAS